MIGSGVFLLIGCNEISRSFSSWVAGLFHPISNEDVRLAWLCAVSVRCEHQLLTIRREHRKTIEALVVSDALQPASVDVDYVEIKVAAFRIGDVRRKYYALGVRKEIRRETRCVQMRDLPLVRTVRVHHPNVEHGRSNQILFQ